MVMDVKKKIMKEPLYILCVDNPSEELIELAIDYGGVELLHLFINDSIFDKYCTKYGYDELHLIKNLNGLSESKMQELLFKDYKLISKYDNPSERLQVFAVNRNPESVRLINNPSLLAWMEAVKKQPSLIQYFINPPDELQMTAVARDASSIKYIEHPSIQIQRYVVRLAPENICYIKNIDEDVACGCIRKYGKSVFMFLNKTGPKVLSTMRELLKDM